MVSSASRSEEVKRAAITYGPLLAALIIEFAAFEYIGRRHGNPGFFSVNTLMLVLNQSVVYGIMAVGMTFVIITAGIDLSVGSVLAVAGVIAAYAAHAAGDALWPYIVLGWAAAILFGVVVGALHGFFVTRFAVPPFIITLASMSSLRGLGNLGTDGKPIAPLPVEYSLLGRYRVGGELPLSVIVFVVVLIAGLLLLHHTGFGRHVRAIGGNEESARLSGVPVKRVKMLVYVICSALAALSGVILSSRLGSGSPKVGVADELGVIAAVVIGGTSLSGGRGTIVGTVMGLLVVSVLNSGLTWVGVETFGQQVTLGLVILGAVLLDKAKGQA